MTESSAVLAQSCDETDTVMELLNHTQDKHGNPLKEGHWIQVAHESAHTAMEQLNCLKNPLGRFHRSNLYCVFAVILSAALPIMVWVFHEPLYSVIMDAFYMSVIYKAIRFACVGYASPKAREKYVKEYSINELIVDIGYLFALPPEWRFLYRAKCYTLGVLFRCFVDTNSISNTSRFVSMCSALEKYSSSSRLYDAFPTHHLMAWVRFHVTLLRTLCLPAKLKAPVSASVV